MTFSNISTWEERITFSGIHLPVFLLLEWVARKMLTAEVKTLPLCSVQALLIGWLASMVWDICEACNCSTFLLDPLCFSDSLVWHAYWDIITGLWFLMAFMLVTTESLRTNSGCHQKLQLVLMHYSLLLFSLSLNLAYLSDCLHFVLQASALDVMKTNLQKLLNSYSCIRSNICNNELVMKSTSPEETLSTFLQGSTDNLFQLHSLCLPGAARNGAGVLHESKMKSIWC